MHNFNYVSDSFRYLAFLQTENSWYFVSVLIDTSMITWSSTNRKAILRKVSRFAFRSFLLQSNFLKESFEVAFRALYSRPSEQILRRESDFFASFPSAWIILFSSHSLKRKFPSPWIPIISASYFLEPLFPRALERLLASGIRCSFRCRRAEHDGFRYSFVFSMAWSIACT